MANIRTIVTPCDVNQAVPASSASAESHGAETQRIASRGRDSSKFPRVPTLQELILEVQLRIASYLSWHEACALWMSLLERTPSHASHTLWCSLISANVAQRGHDDTFLADLSTLRDVEKYQPVITAYQALYAKVVNDALKNYYSPSRMMRHILISDDYALLSLLLDTQKLIKIDMPAVLEAIDRRAIRCLQLLFAESLSARSATDTNDRGRVKIDFPSRSVSTDSDGVDFSQFPQRLLWSAGLTQNQTLCLSVFDYLCVRSGEEGAKDLAMWSACCGAAFGHEHLLAHCGAAALCGPLSRVTFYGPSSGGEISFEDAPLAVIAASRGHVGVLGMLALSGVNVKLCTRRGLTAVGAARQHPSQSMRGRLLGVLRNTGALPRGNSSGTESAAGTTGNLADTQIFYDNSPVEDTIERGDLSSLREMLQYGAKLEACDIMAAVRSGDLDVLAVVQAQCAASGGQTEYRRMMRKTAREIHDSNRGRARSLTNSSSSGDIRDTIDRSSSNVLAGSAGRALRNAGVGVLRNDGSVSLRKSVS